MEISPYTQGYYDGYADLCDKHYWYDSVEEITQYLRGVGAGRLDAKIEAQQHNERHTHA
jgi:hypothetical protein